MMKKVFYLMMSFCSFLEAQESISELGNKAKAFADTRDFTQASQIYEELSLKETPDWQKALILYDWGTVKLLQQDWASASKLFNQISPSAISSPQFLRSWTLNRAVAFLGQAKQLSFQENSSLEERRYLIWQSLKNLEEAKKVDCRLQKIEQSISDCSTPSDLDFLFKKNLLELNQTNHQLRDHFLASLDYPSLITILHDSLQTAIHFCSFFTQNGLPEDFKSTYKKYFIFQTKSTEPLWKQLKSLKSSVKELTIIEPFFQNNDAILSSMENENWAEVTRYLQSNLELLQTLASQTDLEILILQYQLVLLNKIDEISLKQLLTKQLSLPQQQSLQQVDLFLKKGIEEIQLHHPFLSRFFVVLALLELENLLISKDATKNSKQILRRALQTAIKEKELTQLLSLSEDFSKTPLLLKEILNKQNQVLEQSSSFIPTVLEEENRNFRSLNFQITCQKHPWEQTIPLFEKGELAARQTQLWLKNSPLELATILNQQQKTIDSWQQALNVLETSSEEEISNQDASHPSSQPKNSENIDETLRLLQEMQANDQPQKGQTPKERQAW